MNIKFGRVSQGQGDALTVSLRRKGGRDHAEIHYVGKTHGPGN